ncbi:hypothetical protein DH2020_042830 [Rehmannia glutinosa]|uniref:Protein kinase domain-containing protein n=1 Tax=Rehmannia glutinosa TaxID=99300 RepID=A0ABR0UM44_REHGL
MLSRFRDGFPEDFIVVALQKAIKGLSFIHENGQVHGEISAGHIFFSVVPEIKIGFSATVYDEGPGRNDPSSSSSVPVSSVLEWAAAPEIYNNNNSEYTAKADIWMVGITALELAYGEMFTYMERSEFLSQIQKLAKKQRLPVKNQGEIIGKPKDNRKRNSVSLLWVKLKKNFKKRAFSRKFEEMVFKCLAMDPAKRPSADELLNMEIFSKENEKGEKYFQDLSTKLQVS